MGNCLFDLMTAFFVTELRALNSDPTMDIPLPYRDVLFLNLIYSNPECTVTWLAEQAHVTKPTATARVNSLERKGLVVREASERDGRVKLIRLSDEMKDSFAVDSRILDKTMSGLRERYGEERMKGFEEMVGYATEALSMQDTDPSEASG